VRRGRPCRASFGGQKPSGTSGSEGYAGIRRSRAPGGARASSGCSMNPMGAAGLQQIRWFSGWSNTLGRRSDASRLACNSARPDAEGSSVRGEERGRKPLRRPGNDVLRRGLGSSGTTYVEPDRTGSSVFKAVELSDLVFLRVRGRRAPWTKGRSGRSDASRPCRLKELREREPQERQRT